MENVSSGKVTLVLVDKHFRQFMKAAYLLFAVLLLVLTGCSTAHPGSGRDRIGSETVLITYHVQSGKELEFQALLSHAFRPSPLKFKTPLLCQIVTSPMKHLKSF